MCEDTDDDIEKEKGLNDLQSSVGSPSQKSTIIYYVYIDQLGHHSVEIKSGVAECTSQDRHTLLSDVRKVPIPFGSLRQEEKDAHLWAT